MSPFAYIATRSIAPKAAVVLAQCVTPTQTPPGHRICYLPPDTAVAHRCRHPLLHRHLHRLSHIAYGPSQTFSSDSLLRGSRRGSSEHELPPVYRTSRRIGGFGHGVQAIPRKTKQACHFTAFTTLRRHRLVPLNLIPFSNLGLYPSWCPRDSAALG